MRTIKRTTRFKKDYKREAKGRHAAALDKLLLATVKKLARGDSLPPRFQDHPLSGDWSDHRDCHIKPDLLLIYRLTEDDELVLVRLGSHSELFL